jgi:anaerobic selenocysteine-containing dehydrogenase
VRHDAATRRTARACDDAFHLAGPALIRTFCRFCEVGCGLLALVEGGKLIRLRPDRSHPVTRGFACSTGLRAREIHDDPDRVRAPQRNMGGRFADVSWEAALGEIAARVQELIERCGPRSVGLYLGNPNAFNALGSAAARLFTAALGTDRVFSAVTQDCSNKFTVAELLYGIGSANPIPDLERTELLLVIGSNPRVSKSSFWSVANPVQALRSIRDRGGRVVFVNPREIEPDIGETLQIRPGSDPYLLAALLHEIHRTAGFRLGALEGRVAGVDDVAAFVERYSPEAVAGVVGLPADGIARLARDFACAPGASIHASTGLNMGPQGALAYWLVQMLLLLSGNLDRPGGSYFAARGLAIPPARADRSRASFESSRWGSYRRSVGMLPAALLSEIIGDPDEPLRALFVLAGNPALSVGGGERLRASLASLDLLVSIDLYRNATGELAHFVLPATDQLEREDVNFFVQGVQGEPFLQWTPRVVQPDGAQREEWRILGELLQAMGRKPAIDPASSDPLPLIFDGPLRASGLSIGRLREAGGAVVLPEPGPGRSAERLGIAEPIQCVADALRSTLERGHTQFDAMRSEDPGGFKLITRRTRGSLNSTLANLPGKQESRAPNPLWMHPDDGARLGLVAGARALIRNEYGAIESEVEFDARLRPGVVAMTHGFGNAAAPGMSVARERAGVNVNALAPHGPATYDPVSCMSQITAIPVEVRAAAESPR